ncbi:MAG: hypothetical protein WBA77_13725 [Microcoleaceae cyanobacterium]
MVLRPETDPVTGELRLVGNDFPENVTFFPGELGVFPQGVLMLGGNDTVQGSSDGELIQGNQDNDLLFGGGGNDTLLGGQHNDQLQGEEGNDLIFGEKAEDLLYGGVGDDSLLGGLAADEINGDSGNDTLFGGADNDSLQGGKGSDLILGDRGGDRLFGGEDNDSLLGGLENDQLRGDGGDDVLRGEENDDFLSGSEGDDFLFGGMGNDRLLGDQGNDQLYGEQGSDTLVGGEGNDRFILEPGTGGNSLETANFIFDFTPGEDLIFLLGNIAFEDLELIADPRNSRNTVIAQPNGEFFLILQNIAPETISSSDFFVPGILNFSATEFSVIENGTIIDPITINRIGGSSGEVSVTVIPTPISSAEEEIDTTPILVEFAAGDFNPKTINIGIQDDNIVESNDRVQLTLTNPTGLVTLGTPNQAILNIIDNEPRPETIQTFENPNPQAFSQFGEAIATNTNNILIGAPGQENSQGIAYLFDSNTGQILQTFQNFEPTSGASEFGSDLGFIAGDVLVSAPGDSSLALNTGAVYRLSPVTGGIVQTFVNPTPDAFDLFGFSIATIGTTVIVGAPNDSSSGFKTGVVYLFDGNTGQLLRTINNPNPQVQDYFGADVAAVGDWVLVGAPGSLNGESSQRPGVAYIFDSATGELIQGFQNPNPSVDEFGAAVAWTGIGRDILIGAPGDDSRGIDGGAAFLFDGITAATFQSYTPPNIENGGEFGAAFARLGNDVLVGAPGYGLFDTGSLFQFELRSGNFQQTYLNPISDNNEIPLNFGSAIAATGNNIVVGAPGLSDTVLSQGQVNLF